MTIKDGEFPPNYERIATVLDLKDAKPLFTYKDVVYNPYKAELRPDLLIHEEIHSKQQGSDPEAWWTKYLEDPKFRLSQELDAYSIQYGYVKKLVTNKKSSWFLDRLAEILASPMYGNLLTVAKARSKIRNNYKRIVENSK